jgi:hypothetical protein
MYVYRRLVHLVEDEDRFPLDSTDDSIYQPKPRPHLKKNIDTSADIYLTLISILDVGNIQAIGQLIFPMSDLWKRLRRALSYREKARRR